MPVYNESLQSELDQLVDVFNRRQQWWDEMIALAEVAREKHRRECRDRATALTTAKTHVDGFNGGQKIIGKQGTPASDGLQGFYAQQEALQDIVANPLRGLPVSSPLSAASPKYLSLYGRPFWAKYEQLLKKGEHKAAERMLNGAGGKLRAVVLFFTGHGKETAGWRADIAAARAQLPAHREAFAKLKAVNREVEKGEKDTAKIIRKLLKNGTVHQALQNMQAQGVSSPELALLIDYAGRSERPSLKEIRADLETQRENFNLQSLGSQMQSVARQGGNELRGARLAMRAAQARQDLAAGFQRSCRITKAMETKTSLVIGGICANMSEKLENFSLGLAGPADSAEKFARAAEVKMQRWVNQQAVENNLATLGQTGFNPQALETFPSKRYAFNAASHSGTRTVHYTVAALKGAFKAVIARPAMRIFGGAPPAPPPQPPGP